jgi:acid phosphatase (class A)
LNLRHTVLLAAAGVLFALIAAGCGTYESETASPAVKEIAPGLLEGYLATEELPNSLELLPPPPEEGSAGFTLDEERSREALALRGTPRWQQAARDANLHFPEAAEAFSGVIGIPITEEETPHLYMLLHRSLTDAGLSTYRAKNHYNRARPFMMNREPICTPEDRDALTRDGSYPSGHTAIGWAWALILCEIFPERTDEILARGREFGESRMVCNVHWQSDVQEGRFMGAATVARLHADAGFLTDLERAKREVEELKAAD